ncbi:MAG: hypothetical protein H6700_10650 [Myxococcales bacterium]|nr:hypothetical protein [Myxococcales bacterium]
MNGLCSTGQYIVGVNQDGSVLCGFDADTVQFAGFGLTESEGYFDVDFDLVQARVTGGCGDGTAIVDIDSEGGVSCEQFGHIDGVYGGAGITAFEGSSGGYVTVNIAADGIEPYMHSWGVPLDVPFTLNQPVTYCGDSSPPTACSGRSREPASISSASSASATTAPRWTEPRSNPDQLLWRPERPSGLRPV